MSGPAIFDKIAFQYDENRGGIERGERFAASLVPLLNKAERVLEIGVGTAAVASAIERAGFNIIGVDVSKEMLKVAAGRLRQVVWADMNTLPFIDACFGTVYAVWALHLARDTTAMLREIRRVLKDGGYFLNCSAANRHLAPVSDEAERIALEVHAALAGPELTVDAPHQLKEIANAAGFELETIVPIAHEYETTPEKVALHLERRGMSILQQATEKQVQDIIDPAVRAIRALPQQVLRRQRMHQISVLRAT